MSVFTRAYDASNKAAREGFDWEDWRGAFDKVLEELEEVRQEILHANDTPHYELVEEFGDLIFSIMSLARHIKIDPEEACRVGVEKFERRYGEYKVFAESKGVNILTSPPGILENLWEEYKLTLKVGE